MAKGYSVGPAGARDRGPAARRPDRRGSGEAVPDWRGDGPPLEAPEARDRGAPSAPVWRRTSADDPAEQERVVREMIAEQPDLTDQEAAWEYHRRSGISVSKATMGRTLRKLGLTRKE